MRKTRQRRTRQSERNRKAAGLFVLAVGTVAGLGAQTSGPPRTPPLAFSVGVDGWFPTLLDSGADIVSAVGGTAQVSYAPLPFIEALARFGVHSLRLASNDSLLYVGGSGGLGYVARLYERFSVGVSAFAGLGKVPDYNGQSFGLYELGLRLETSFRLTAALSLGLNAGYERLANPNTGPFMDAVAAGLRLKVYPGELRKKSAGLSFEKVETKAIFPVFRSWYDAEPFGAVTLRNNEDGAIENVRVSFYAPEYMGGPRVSTLVPRVESGKSVTIPLYAVFDERILALTENSSTSAEIGVEYSFLGSQRGTSQQHTLVLHHRNAMSWEDDRRAAAFVSPTDPATLWFARYSTSIVRDRMRTELPPNLQYALGVFESLKLYGLNYVVDPNSSYLELSENAAVVDYLQYPSQTLMYRGGDCDDLSILYCSLLESTGIATAFITIPGHIFMAFDLGMDEAEAREKFFDPGLLIFRNGRTWAPVEITMVKDGFVKAWRIGAKEWIDNERLGAAAFFPMTENWARYKPSGLQDAEARFALPEEAKAMAAFDLGVDRFTAREMEPLVKDYEMKLAAERSPEVLNEYGVAMARVGMLDPAWERFTESAKAGYAWAWNNLANIAFVRKDYKLAYSYYQYATTLLPGDPVAILGMARCAYELDRYGESGILYQGLREEAPLLAERFGYLASAYGGEGRAWSMADRLGSSVWAKPGLDFTVAAPARAPEIAAAPPEPPARAPVVVEVPPDEPVPAAPVEAPPPVVEAPAPEPVVVVEEAPPIPTPAVVMEAPPAPPEVAQAPQDGDIAAVAAETAEEARILVAAPPETAPLPSVVAPPSVVVVETPLPALAAVVEAPPPEVAEAPQDGDIAAVAAETAEAVTLVAAVAVAVEAPPEEVPQAPVVVVEVPPAAAPALVVEASPPEAPAPAPTVSATIDLSAPSLRVASGSWTRTARTARMDDPLAMSAKLVIPTPGAAGPAVYEFSARSAGVAWVGFGLHLHGRGEWKLSGYGGGDSLLVWITSDPKASGDAAPRLQVYESSGEVNMKMVASVRLEGSVYDSRAYRVAWNPATGRLEVSVDGVPGLTVDLAPRAAKSDYAALRALDLTEFSDLCITPQIDGPAAMESSDE